MRLEAPEPRGQVVQRAIQDLLAPQEQQEKASLGLRARPAPREMLERQAQPGLQARLALPERPE